ncbi:MAG: polysulfide reductase NrfD [Anaerolineae bacterium]|nr:polysulfide reductase NrfD [Anaerolineae bacterium]
MSVLDRAESRPGVARTRAEEEHRKTLLLDPRPQEELNTMVLEAMQRTGREYWVVVGVLAVLALGGFLGAWLYMILTGVGVTGLSRPNYWGIFIASFIFWIGISHAGTFISAILRIFGAEYRRPITRAAEMMTTTSLLVAASFLGIHVGRVWVSYWIVPYPNQRGLWPNYHSPFLWDEMAIITYLVGSTLYLYLPLIPDLAMARDRLAGWRGKLYRAMALGWTGTESQWHHLNLAIKVFSVVIIPVMFSVHTIVSWDLAMTKAIGWRSSIFAPYFIVGAVYSGLSAAITVLIIARSSMKLHYFIREEHINALARLVLIFSFTWTYFFFADFLTEWYGGDAAGHTLITLQTVGQMAPFWWTMLFFNIVVPWLTLWNGRIRRSPIALLLITIGINIGMYLERYIIVTGFLRRNHTPFNWGDYAPSVVEIAIIGGSLCTFLLLYALLSRLVPLIPVWEVREGQLTHGLRRVGRATVPTVAELEE